MTAPTEFETLPPEKPIGRYGYALFAEDLRQERSGQVSIVGVFSPRIMVKTFPLKMPKLVVFAVLGAPLKTPPRRVLVSVSGSWSKEPLFQGEMAPADGETHIRISPQSANSDMMELRLTPTMVDLEVPGAGRILVRLFIDDEELPSSVLRFEQGTSAIKHPAVIATANPPTLPPD